MADLELAYDSVDTIPEAYRPLFTETDGKFNFTGVNGMKSVTDVNKVQEGLRKEREDHSVTKTSLKAWGDLVPADTLKSLDRIKELELAAGGKLDEDAINGMVESRITQKTAPLERSITDLTTDRDEWKTKAESLQTTIQKRDMGEAVGTVALEMKVHGVAIDDVKMVAERYLELDEHTGAYVVRSDAQGVTPGLDIKGFMKEMQKVRPFWWPESEGGGAGGGGKQFGGSENPWSKDNWNITKQGRVLKEQGRETAESMAVAAGTKFNGPRPTK